MPAKKEEKKAEKLEGKDLIREALRASIARIRAEERVFGWDPKKAAKRIGFYKLALKALEEIK